jgi:2-polyprenyl-6-methoxyphenol hydroxylase-like FAD-dependent oxidoreductase
VNIVIAGGGIAGPALGVALAKAGLGSTILEARPEGAAGGAFLNLAPNGINALAAIGLGDVVERAGGVPLTGIRFRNAAGREVGHLDGRDEVARFGARNHLVRRDRLHQVLEDAARAAGVEVRRGAEVASIEEHGDGVRVGLADGTAVDADVLLGADGVHSAVRRLAFPDAPRPAYTGILNAGAWTPIDLPDTPEQQLVFGRRAFFGYVVHRGVAYWFSNVARRDDPTEGDRSAVDPSTWLPHIRELHAEDPDPVPAILAAATGVAGVWPVHDVAELPTWHRGRIGLLGDAAHATSPNAGQGASLALEDAVVLAACLRDVPDPAAALRAFESLRKDRAEKIVELSRRLGRSKVPSRLGAWFRDRTLPFFLRAGAAETVEKYGYRVDFDAPVAGAPVAAGGAGR